MYPEPLRRLLEELERLPGVGARTAERFAFHILKAEPEEALRLAAAIGDVKRSLRPCARCGMVTEAELCPTCADPTRDAGTVCVVEQPRHVWAIERTGSYRGVYHVLMGSMALLEGVEERHLNIAPLEERVRAGEVSEVILATEPSLEGDTTALHLIERLERLGVRITRIARGVAAGSSLAHAPRAVIEDALEERRSI